VRFLVVDDSRAMQSIVKRALQKAGYRSLDIKLANDGVEALEIIKVWTPDMVLSDWHMPNMSGLELLAAIARQMLDVKVGFVTTEASESRIQEAKAAGALFVINKPFSDEELLSAVTSTLQASTSASNHSHDEVVPAELETNNLDIQLKLPSSETFARIVNATAHHEVLVEAIEPIKLEDKLMPCVLGLYDDEHAKTRAIIVMDLRAASILGAVMCGASPQEARQSIAQQTIAKNLLDGCKLMLTNAGSMVSDSKTQRALSLRSINTIPTSFPKLESIYQRQEVDRSDFEIAVVGYGQGLMTIIAT